MHLSNHVVIQSIIKRAEWMLSILFLASMTTLTWPTETGPGTQVFGWMYRYNTLNDNWKKSCSRGSLWIHKITWRSFIFYSFLSKWSFRLTERPTDAQSIPVFRTCSLLLPEEVKKHTNSKKSFAADDFGIMVMIAIIMGAITLYRHSMPCSCVETGDQLFHLIR